MFSPIYGWYGTTPTRIQTGPDGRLIVRGEDQVFTFKEVLHSQTVAIVSGAGGYIQSPVVGAGEYWIVTTITARNATRPTTKHWLGNVHNGLSIPIHDQSQAFTVFDHSDWHGHTFLDVGDRIRAEFFGSLAGDTCVLNITGFIMTVET